MKAIHVGMLNSLYFSIICEAENMQDLPFLNPFSSSYSRTSAIALNLFAILFE